MAFADLRRFAQMSDSHRMRGRIFHTGPAGNSMDALDMLRAKKMAKKMEKTAAAMKAEAKHLSHH